MAKRLFTSESVTEGHPDKICDQISDAVLDAILENDPTARVACETTVTTGLVHVMGEITTSCYVDIPKNTLLSEKVPIYVKLSASQLKLISGHVDTMLRIERDKFAHDLTLKNGFVMAIVTESITAANSLTILNHGTMTCHVKEWNTACINVYNAGYLYMHGQTTAKSVVHKCAKKSVNDVCLDVDCDNLQIFSRGKGVLRYRGMADDVQVSALGKGCTIYTSELNQ